jgi:hypothetical protein
MQFSTTKGENMFDFKSEPEAKPIWDYLLNDPKMEQATREIFRYVVQPNLEVKYKESTLTLEQIYMINLNFMLSNENAGYYMKKGKQQQLKDKKKKNN